MASLRQNGRSRWVGFAASAIIGCLFTALPAFAGQAADGEKPNFFGQVFKHLVFWDSRALMDTLGQPEYIVAAFLVLNAVVFVETGLLIGFFLPGDSLLVTAGLVAARCDWNVPILLGTLSLSAIIGDSIGYMIGFNTGPKIFRKERSLFFNKGHLLKAQAFYERHGGKTIFLARFMPFVRTFAPVVAGVGRMDYKHFVFFNVFGGVSWVCGMVLCGYFLPSLLNPLLRKVFGDAFAVEEHVEKVIIVVVLLSIAPGILMWIKSRLAGSPAQHVEEQSPANVAG